MNLSFPLIVDKKIPHEVEICSKTRLCRVFGHIFNRGWDFHIHNIMEVVDLFSHPKIYIPFLQSKQTIFIDYINLLLNSTKMTSLLYNVTITLWKLFSFNVYNHSMLKLRPIERFEICSFVNKQEKSRNIWF